MKELAFATTVLEVLRPAAHLVVYGGAIRDTMLNLPIKDVDIAFECDYVYDNEHLFKAINECGLFINKVPSMEELDKETYEGHVDEGDFICHFEMVPKTEGMPNIDFVGASVPDFGRKGVADRCDWSFCQASFDLDCTYQSVNYKLDIFNNRATYCVKNPAASALKRSLERRKRFAKKFPNWEFRAHEDTIKKHKIGRKLKTLKPEEGDRYARH